MIPLRYLPALALCLLAACSPARHTRPAEIPAVAGSATVPTGQARNVILFIGDGMGLTTATAARILEGQMAGGTGEENLLAFEEFPHTALAKTYNSNQQTPDSAGTASAIMTGVKTRAGVINIGPDNRLGDCAGSHGQRLLSLSELARAAGLATGVVTTTRITHATPATTYARSAQRNWEVDSAMPEQALADGCVDIARQLLEPIDGRGHDVVLGGGRAMFMPAAHTDPEYPERHGRRADGRDLLAQWQAGGGHYVWNARQFAAIPNDSGQRVLGLFEPSHMRYELERADDPAGEPSLAEMTVKAMDLLAARGNGYLLLVEAGRIDHGHHAGNAARALHDTVALSAAVRATVARANDDTLIVVTSDHSHTFTMTGYPTRGNPILGLVRGNDAHGEPSADPTLDRTGQPYTTLGYANGPGYLGASDQQPQGHKTYPHLPESFQPIGQVDADADTGHAPLDDQRAADIDFMQAATVALASETHGGEDVPVYAMGPGSEQVRGVIEQNLLFRILVQSHPALRAQLCNSQACPGQPRAAWTAPMLAR